MAAEQAARELGRQPIPLRLPAPARRHPSRVVTDLSQLSSSNPLAQLDQQRQLLSGQSTPQSSQPSNQTVSNIGRFYIANQKTGQLIEAPSRPPGDARLLNAKAAQYP